MALHVKPNTFSTRVIYMASNSARLQRLAMQRLIFLGSVQLKADLSVGLIDVYFYHYIHIFRCDGVSGGKTLLE